MVDLSGLPVVVNAGLFLAAAVAIVVAGRRLARAVDRLIDVTGMGRAFTGAVLLGGIAVLPEAATMVSASVLGDATLATGNLFGSLSFNIVVLVVADAVVRGPITAAVDRASLRRQGTIVLGLLALTALAILVPGPSLGRLGLWSVVLAASVVGAFAFLHRVREPGEGAPDVSRRSEPVRWTAARIAALAAVIVVGGYLAADAAETLSLQLELGSGLVGFLLLAGATSVPEISTAVGAARIGEQDLAVADVFGASIFNMALLFVGDLAYEEGAILEAVGAEELGYLAVAAATSAAFLAGVRWPHVNVAGRLSVASVLAAVAYLGGTALVVLAG